MKRYETVPFKAEPKYLTTKDIWKISNRSLVFGRQNGVTSIPTFQIKILVVIVFGVGWHFFSYILLLIFFTNKLNTLFSSKSRHFLVKGTLQT